MNAGSKSVSSSLIVSASFNATLPHNVFLANSRSSSFPTDLDQSNHSFVLASTARLAASLPALRPTTAPAVNPLTPG